MDQVVREVMEEVHRLGRLHSPDGTEGRYRNEEASEALRTRLVELAECGRGLHGPLSATDLNEVRYVLSLYDASHLLDLSVTQYGPEIHRLIQEWAPRIVT
jgi:hypothetical protein